VKKPIRDAAPRRGGGGNHRTCCRG
jgi:hypothetical protein